MKRSHGREFDAHSTSTCSSGKQTRKRTFAFPRINLTSLLLNHRQPGRRRCTAATGATKRRQPGIEISDSRSESSNVSTSHHQQHLQVSSASNRDVDGSSVSSSTVSSGSCGSAGTGGDRSRSLGRVMECPLCLTEQSKRHLQKLSTCQHRSCLKCMQQYLQIEITESRVNITCPACPERLTASDIKHLLSTNIPLWEKYQEFTLRRLLVADPDTRWCPAADCGFAVIASGCASCPKLQCQRDGCDTFFCYHCKQEWHPNLTCDAARAQRNSPHHLHSGGAAWLNNDDIKACPRCAAFIMKMDDGSCNHMTCAVCGAEFCWLCMKEISDLHYLSPSGCTFWGKKPWSRKKKILWQLGTLVGAPVGIALVAGVAIPAMCIGIPVWVGRQIFARYKKSGRHKRNILITSGVSATVLVSPVVAGLTVAIGVPILLAYVYGVVPVSLCRSGGCGVSTSSSGVHIQFDEDELTNNATAMPSFSGAIDGQSMTNNASIGEAASMLGMTSGLSASGQHMERAGATLRNDTDSNRALTGSLSGSIVVSNYHRMEVLADVTKRGAGDSTTNDDNASTRALNGSIASYREKEVQQVVVAAAAAAASSSSTTTVTDLPSRKPRSVSIDERLSEERASGRLSLHSNLSTDDSIWDNTSLGFRSRENTDMSIHRASPFSIASQESAALSSLPEVESAAIEEATTPESL